MMKEYLLKLLQPGDILFYSGTSWASWLIKLKTYSEWTHVAVYLGNGLQREFVEGVGPQVVPLRIKNLGMIKRRYGNWSKTRSDEYWDTVKDQTYDYWGLILGFIARRQGRENKSMWCSEYITRDDRYAVDGQHLFADEVDADGVSPADVGRSPAAFVIWMAKEGHL